MKAKYMFGDNLLISYLDLCGTKFIYSNSSLDEQIERISMVISEVLSGVENTFGDKKESLFVHAYADSVVIAERPSSRIDTDKLVTLMLKLQYNLLTNSESLKIQRADNISKAIYMPILTRSLVKRGKYYGLITAFDTNIDNLFTNFSLIGGPSIVEMDNTLQGLPMGTYVDAAITSDLNADLELFDVMGDKIKFVKPTRGFDDLRSIFSSDINNRPENIDDWGKRLIESADNNIDLKSKLIPWLEAIQGRRSLIAKRAKGD